MLVYSFHFDFSLIIALVWVLRLMTRNEINCINITCCERRKQIFWRINIKKLSISIYYIPKYKTYNYFLNCIVFYILLRIVKKLQESLKFQRQTSSPMYETTCCDMMLHKYLKYY